MQSVWFLVLALATIGFMYIRVRVRAEAKKDSLEKLGKDSFAVSVKAPAEQNLANKRVLELVAEYFNITPRQVRIISGHHAPGKILSIPDPEV